MTTMELIWWGMALLFAPVYLYYLIYMGFAGYWQAKCLYFKTLVEKTSKSPVILKGSE